MDTNTHDKADSIRMKISSLHRKGGVFKSKLKDDFSSNFELYKFKESSFFLGRFEDKHEEMLKAELNSYQEIYTNIILKIIKAIEEEIQTLEEEYKNLKL